MNHRRGQRWRTDLLIRITLEQMASPLQAQLQDLSYHGARVCLRDYSTKPGTSVKVWLPEMNKPIRALVVHRCDETLGLLWIEHSPWVEHTLMDILRRSPQPTDTPASVQRAPNSGPNWSVNFGLPQSLPTITKMQKRA